MGSPRERMLRLLSLLQSGRQWPASDLAEAMSATPRTLRRDIENLRELGYPVQSLRGPGGYYQLVAGRSLPPLMLEDDEAIATVLGLRLAAAEDAGSGRSGEAAQRAEAKLRRLLPAKLQQTTDNLVAAIDIAATTRSAPTPMLLRTLAQAIAIQQTVRFTYTSAKGAAERVVEPARLVLLQQRWYLFAWDTQRGDWRTFRLDRIIGQPDAGSRFTPRLLPDDDVVTYLRGRFRGVPELTVRLTFHTDADTAASGLYRLDGTLEPLTDETCRYTAHVDSYAWLTLVLTLTDLDFTIDQPDEYKQYLSRHAHRLARAAGENR